MLPPNSISMCCTAASPGAQGAPTMSHAGGLVICLFGMGVVYFECTATCLFVLKRGGISCPSICFSDRKPIKYKLPIALQPRLLLLSVRFKKWGIQMS